jgi:phenylacetate-CoA ligase
MAKIDIFTDSLLTLKGIFNYHSILKKSCYWDVKTMQTYQFDKLYTLLNSAYMGIPYYKNLFDSIGFNPKTDFKTLEDLKKIPILSKEEARFLGGKRLIDERYEKDSLVFRTSGSSGSPFQVSIYKQQWAIEQGVIWRHWAWNGYKFRDKMAIVRSFVPPNDQHLTRKEVLRNFMFFSPFHLNDQQMAIYLDTMIAEKVTILRGYPSSLATLAEFVLRTKHAVPPNIKTALVASEFLSDQDRYIIETAFKTKVSNHYGLAEQIVMMGDCEKHEGLHNYEEYGYLELLDTDQPNIKRIIGTNLHNITMPLIRYDTGDLAEISEQPCSCGRTLPTIKNIIGRSDASIQTPEGYTIPTVNFYTLFETYTDLFRWQIVQHSINKIEVILKPKGDFPPERIAELRTGLYARLPASVAVEININAPFIQKGEGKTNTFVKLF